MRVAKHDVTNLKRVFHTAESCAAKLPDEGMAVNATHSSASVSTTAS